MTFLLVPHEVTDTTATIWVGAIDEADVRERAVEREYGADNDGEVISLGASG